MQFPLVYAGVKPLFYNLEYSLITFLKTTQSKLEIEDLTRAQKYSYDSSRNVSFSAAGVGRPTILGRSALGRISSELRIRWHVAEICARNAPPTDAGPKLFCRASGCWPQAVFSSARVLIVFPRGGGYCRGKSKFLPGSNRKMETCRLVLGCIEADFCK